MRCLVGFLCLQAKLCCKHSHSAPHVCGVCVCVCVCVCAYLFTVCL
ncbi:MAG: hypothetical protein P4L40_13620 [Terracidiphilus sp.]|nr:hypothetical protein [Terracidiphilus sp.]